MSFSLDFRRLPGPDGPLALARVPWDSETFGLAVHQLRLVDPEDASDALTESLQGLAAELDAERPYLVEVKIPVSATAAARALAAAGFYPVETMVSLHMPLARFKPPVARVPAGLRLRPARDDELPQLQEMARGAFHADRFHLDPSLSSEAADRRYVQWLARASAAGEPVFVFEDERRARLLGFFHVRETEEGVVDLSLAAVEPGARRLGLGLLMYQAVVEECRQRGFRVAETHVTVHNLDVVNLFARLGFAVRDPVLCFHRFEPAS